MTNREILHTEKVLRGITEKVDTYAGWKKQGRQVKQGSKAMIKTTIWKPVEVKIKDKDGNETGEVEQKMIMVAAAFFGESQTESARTEVEEVA